jgi:hypothetical protein
MHFQGKFMSKKSTVAALVLALSGLAATPIAHAADAPKTPAGAEQKNPCGPKKDATNPCGPAKKKLQTHVDQQILVAQKNVRQLINYT